MERSSLLVASALLIGVAQSLQSKQMQHQSMNMTTEVPDLEQMPMDPCSMMMMPMVFEYGTEVIYLFRGIKSVNPAGYAGEIVFTFLLGFVIEAISYYRYKYQALAYATASQKATTDDISLPLSDKLMITMSYLYSTVLSYALMLVVMTFNMGLFCAAVAGLTFGYLIFGYFRKTSKHTQGEKLYNPEGDKCCTADVEYD